MMAVVISCKFLELMELVSTGVIFAIILKIMEIVFTRKQIFLVFIL